MSLILYMLLFFPPWPRSSQIREWGVNSLKNVDYSIEFPLNSVCYSRGHCTLLEIVFVGQWPCGVVVARLPDTQEDPGSTPVRGSYLRQVSLH